MRCDTVFLRHLSRLIIFLANGKPSKIGIGKSVYGAAIKRYWTQ